MAIDTATPSPATTLAVPLARLRAAPVSLALGGLVGVSFALRLAAALAHATPLYFPDEYIYGTIARSIATTGHPAIRGTAAHFPALLEPLLAAPFWLLHNAELAYRLTQGMNALAMSLAAVPVYLLCRRIGLGAGFGLGAAAAAVAIPDLLFANFVLADPIAYPLHFREHMRRHENGPAPLLRIRQESIKSFLHEWIESLGRLIQNQ